MSLLPGQIEAQSRRNFLKTFGTSMAGVSLSGIFDGSQVFAAPASTLLNPLAPKPQDFPAKAKACIYLYLYGGPSQMDLFDYKPDLQKSSGKKIKMEIRRREMRDSVLQGSKRTFAQHGRSGLWCSDALPNIAKHMDKLAVIKSLYMDSFAHGSANLQMNCGRVRQGHPALGAWIAHGLGSSNADLPGFVVMLDPRGGPIPGAANWTAGYMPAAYQGTVLRAIGNPVLNLKPSANVTMQMQGDKVDAINALNELHRQGRESYSELSARIATYDLAYQLHTSAPEALDISSEDEKTRERYGLNLPRGDHKLSIPPAHFGRQCLIARRLVERGVRFVQLYHTNWDSHGGPGETLTDDFEKVCKSADQASAALVLDLKERGMLDDTLVIWGGEFGRTPMGENRKTTGRDHHIDAFTMWMAGAGLKKGYIHGQTDELGFGVVNGKVHVHDLHATLLHLLGFDHEQLTYRFQGRDFRLTDVHGRVVKEILA